MNPTKFAPNPDRYYNAVITFDATWVQCIVVKGRDLLGMAVEGGGLMLFGREEKIPDRLADDGYVLVQTGEHGRIAVWRDLTDHALAQTCV